MAERNWRDEFEEVDKDGSHVVTVFYENDKPVCYIFLTRYSKVKNATVHTHLLMLKTKPKTYRPWTIREVPVGSIVIHKDNQTKHLITGINSDEDEMFAVGGYSVATSAFVLHKCFTMLNGTPCGVIES